MKKNDLLEMKSLDIKALTVRVRELRGQIADLVMEKHMNTLKNSKQIQHSRRNLAQMLTILRQKEIIAQLEKGAQS